MLLRKIEGIINLGLMELDRVVHLDSQEWLVMDQLRKIHICIVFIRMGLVLTLILYRRLRGMQLIKILKLVSTTLQIQMKPKKYYKKLSYCHYTCLSTSKVLEDLGKECCYLDLQVLVKLCWPKLLQLKARQHSLI